MPVSLTSAALPDKASRAVYNDAKIAVAEWCSPKSARIESGLAWITQQAFTGKADQHFWWIGPDFSAASAALNLTRSVLPAGSFTPVQRSACFVLMNGALLWFRDGSNSNAFVANNVYAITVDQAIQIPAKTWTNVAQTAANTGASIRVLSTVEGRENWWYDLARRAETESQSNPSLFHYERFTSFDALAEGMISQEDVDYARASLPDHIFRALYNAEPYNDRVEAAHRARDPKLMTDEELILIAGSEYQPNVTQT